MPVRNENSARQVRALSMVRMEGTANGFESKPSISQVDYRQWRQIVFLGRLAQAGRWVGENFKPWLLPAKLAKAITTKVMDRALEAFHCTSYSLLMLCTITVAAELRVPNDAPSSRKPTDKRRTLYSGTSNVGLIILVAKCSETFLVKKICQ